MEETRHFILEPEASLLIKGPAGSGKTSMAMALLSGVANKVIILAPGKSIAGARKKAWQAIPGVKTVMPGTESAREFVQALGSEAGKSARGSIIVIEDIEALSSRLRHEGPDGGKGSESLASLAERELAQKSGASLIITSGRQDDYHLDHIVGGCISLKKTRVDGRLLREIEAEKLEGTAISSTHGIFTLGAGSFRMAPQSHAPERDGAAAGTWERSQPETGRYSSGIPALDRLMGGGYRRGSFTLFEISPEVPEWAALSLIYPSAYNFLSSGSGVLLSLTGAQTPQEIQRSIEAAVGREKYSSAVRIIIPFTQSVRQLQVLSAHTESAKERLNIWKTAVGQLRPTSGSNPILDITDLGGVEHSFEKSSILQMLDEGIRRISYEGDIGIGIMREGSDMARQLGAASARHYRVFERHGTTLIYGVRPKSEIYLMDFEGSYPRFELVPMV